MTVYKCPECGSIDADLYRRDWLSPKNTQYFCLTCTNIFTARQAEEKIYDVQIPESEKRFTE